jgi:hypothetical protein
MPEFIAELNEGRVTGQIDQMHGCCGVAMLYHVRFRHHPLNTAEDLYRAFHKWLMNKPFTETGSDHFGRAVYCMTDNTKGEIAKFCEVAGWEASGPIYNHRSGHRIKLYWLNRREAKKPARASRSEDQREGATVVAPSAQNAPRAAQETPEGAIQAPRRVKKRLVRRSYSGRD